MDWRARGPRSAASNPQVTGRLYHFVQSPGRPTASRGKPNGTCSPPRQLQARARRQQHVRPLTQLCQGVCSLGSWLRPPIDGTKTMPAGVTSARACASWPAPDAIRIARARAAGRRLDGVDDHRIEGAASSGRPPPPRTRRRARRPQLERARAFARSNSSIVGMSAARNSSGTRGDSRDHVEGARLEADLADRRDAPGKSRDDELVRGEREGRRREPRVAPRVHRRRSGMARLPAKRGRTSVTPKIAVTTPISSRASSAGPCSMWSSRYPASVPGRAERRAGRPRSGRRVRGRQRAPRVRRAARPAPRGSSVRRAPSFRAARRRAFLIGEVDRLERDAAARGRHACSAIRTCSAATTPSAPSKRPPCGTESRCDPSSSVRGPRPGASPSGCRPRRPASRTLCSRARA